MSLVNEFDKSFQNVNCLNSFHRSVILFVMNAFISAVITFLKDNETAFLQSNISVNTSRSISVQV